MMNGTNDEWHYVSAKSLSRLSRALFSKNNGDFYCLNCLHSYGTENNLEKHERLYLDNKYCHIKLPKKGKNILSYKADNNQSK